MQLRDLLTELGGVSSLTGSADLDSDVTSVQLDSRLVTPGALFASVVSDPTVSASHVALARAQGALASVGPAGSGADIIVPDGAKAAAQIGCGFHRHPSREVQVVGITGTNGKSSVTHVLSGLLGTMGHSVGSIGTIDIMLNGESVLLDRRTPTTPESVDLQSLLRRFADEGASHVVMEASSIALAERRLDGTDLAVGCFTNLTHDHLDSHGSMEAYERAKLHLFDLARVAVVNNDDVVGRRVAERGNDVTTYAIEGDANLKGEQLRRVGRRTEFVVRAGVRTLAARVEGSGPIVVSNALAALAVSTRLGLDLGDAVEALAQQPGPPGRLQIVELDRPYTVMIDYAHSPDALQQVLETIRTGSQGRIITVFGCGGDRDRAKRPVMGRIAADLSDIVIITNDNPRTEDPKRIVDEILAGADGHRVRVEHDRHRAIEEAIGEAHAGDTVLVAGKGSESYQLVGHRRIPHSDYGAAISIASRR